MRFGATTPPAMSHRLHGVLLVAQGMTRPSVAQMLGDAHHTAANWVQRFRRPARTGWLGRRSTHRTCPSQLEMTSNWPKSRRRCVTSPQKFGLATAQWDGANPVGVFGAGTGREIESSPVSTIVPPVGLSLTQAASTSGASRFVLASDAQKNSAHWRAETTLICGPWMKFTFNSTARAAACGCRPKWTIRFVCMPRRVRASAFSAPCASKTASWSCPGPRASLTP